MPELPFHSPLLVTGGTGFAGSHLIEKLLAEGYSNLHTTSLRGADLGPQVTVHQVDLSDRSAVLELWKTIQPQAIYHLAAIAATGSSFEQADEILHNNTQLQLNVLEATRLHTPTARFLAVGSAETYGLVPPESSASIDEHTPFNPVNPYAVSKVTQEMLARVYANAHRLAIIFARPFNHLGERQTPQFAIAHFAQQIAAIEAGKQPSLKLGNLEAVRDFTDVKDVVNAYQILMKHGIVGEVYNVGSGRGYKIGDVLNQLISMAKVEIKIETDSQYLRPLDVPVTIANSDKLKALGWSPQIDLTETLSRILAYWRNQT
jgi:GDP-4-dehydro-6-deoxy-D-mannose reductase